MTTFVDDEMRFGTGVVSGKVYASAGAAAKAGAAAAKGGTGVPGGPAAAPAPPVETPDASWSKDDIHTYLDDRGITYDGRWSVPRLLELV
jgi:hypothetical protein